MTARDHAPLGSPCWVDLWTSDVDGSRAFYSVLFGWQAEEPSEEFGGYFMFTRDGVPVAGGMGSMGDMAADDTWKVYLDTDDVDRTAAAAESAGATIDAPVMPVADLGRQLVLTDPNGARLGAWQAGTFPGFTVLGEHGAPSWFELLTRDHARALEFYRSAFRWETDLVSDTDEFRYATMRNPEGDGELAGVGDATSFLPDGTPSHWSVYWEVDDVDAALARVKELGGSVELPGEDTPYGRLATAADPAGARFKLRTSPA